MRTDYKNNSNSDNGQYNQYGGGVQAFMKAGHWVFLALVGLIFAMLVYFFTLGGYFSVSPQEAVIVLRFGKYEQTYTSDWHWFLPDPVTSKVVIPTSPQTLQVMFNSGVQANELPPPGPNGELPGMLPGRDRYLLTADECIVHASWSARIQVSDPTRYFQMLRLPENPAGPDDIIIENGEELGRRGPRALLARMLESGEDPRFIARRILICASEDVGLAEPAALMIAQAAFQAAEELGMPEVRIPLAHAAIYVACCPKSNSAYNAINAALQEVREGRYRPVPDHLRSGGKNRGYKYAHDYPNHFVDQVYMPAGYERRVYYHPTEQGHEAKLKARHERRWGAKKK
jgi:hypothetical protein